MKTKAEKILEAHPRSGAPLREAIWAAMISFERGAGASCTAWFEDGSLIHWSHDGQVSADVEEYGYEDD